MSKRGEMSCDQGSNWVANSPAANPSRQGSDRSPYLSFSSFVDGVIELLRLRCEQLPLVTLFSIVALHDCRAFSTFG